VREQLQDAANRPTMAELLDRLRSDEPVDPGEASSAAVRAGRVIGDQG